MWAGKNNMCPDCYEIDNCICPDDIREARYDYENEEEENK